MRVKPGVVYHRGKTRSVIYFKEAEELAANFKELEGGKITAILFPINKNGIGEDLSSGLLLCESTGAKQVENRDSPRAGLMPASFPGCVHSSSTHVSASLQGPKQRVI